MSWRFIDTIQADVLAGEFEGKKRRLIEHFRTRTTTEYPGTSCPYSANWV